MAIDLSRVAIEQISSGSQNSMSPALYTMHYNDANVSWFSTTADVTLFMARYGVRKGDVIFYTFASTIANENSGGIACLNDPTDTTNTILSTFVLNPQGNRPPPFIFEPSKVEEQSYYGLSQRASENNAPPRILGLNTTNGDVQLTNIGANSFHEWLNSVPAIDADKDFIVCSAITNVADTVKTSFLVHYFTNTFDSQTSLRLNILDYGTTNTTNPPISDLNQYVLEVRQISQGNSTPAIYSVGFSDGFTVSASTRITQAAITAFEERWNVTANGSLFLYSRYMTNNTVRNAGIMTIDLRHPLLPVPGLLIATYTP